MNPKQNADYWFFYYPGYGSEQRPTFSTVSIIPGIELRAPGAGYQQRIISTIFDLSPLRSFHGCPNLSMSSAGNWQLLTYIQYKLQ
jgi:hypothetical protein